MPVHVRPTYASYGRSPYVATFHETLIDFDRSHCSWEKGLSTQSTTRRLIDPWVHTQLLFWASQWSRGRKPSSCRWPTIRFTGPISPACNRYLQYLIMEPNPSVLNRHRRGRHELGPYHRHVIGTFNTCSWDPTHLGGTSLPHTHSSTFPTSRFPFPPKGPTRPSV
jgi:hypothetical protein